MCYHNTYRIFRLNGSYMKHFVCNKFIIITLIFSINSSLSGMQFAETLVDVLSTTFNWSTVTIPIIHSLYLHYTAQQQKKIKKNIKSDVPQKIIQLIQQKAKKKNLYNIRCCIKNDGGKFPEYHINNPAQIIYIPETYIKELSMLLETQNKTPEQKIRYK